MFLDISLERSDAVEVIRGLGELRFRGRVQLMSGRDLPLLEEIKRVGERYSLDMLPVLQKPFRAEAILDIVHAAGIAGNDEPGPQVSLHQALCAGRIELAYQPKIDLRSRELAGAEGLARVVHPKHGVLMPGAYLPGADQASLMFLTEFALTAALRDWAEMAHVGAPLLLTVNVPMHALLKLSIAALVRDNRPASPQWPGLILKIAEDQILADLPRAHEIATQLQIYGIRLAISRFGAGRTSLPQLRELPIAEIEIDRRYVSCAENADHATLCRAVIDLSHHFGCQAAAEGIEHLQDLKCLGEMGCDIGQGPIFGRSMPIEKLCALTAQRSLRKQSV